MIKMHEEEINGFDLQLRSMLEDATEKAPRRVWKAVDSALGHSRAPFAKWGWAALSCLAAASLALVLALPGGKAVGTDHMVAAVENEVVEAPQAVVEQEETLLQEPVRHISSRPYAPAKAAASQEVHSESASPVQPETAEAAQAPQDGGRAHLLRPLLLLRNQVLQKHGETLLQSRSPHTADLVRSSHSAVPSVPMIMYRPVLSLEDVTQPRA